MNHLSIGIEHVGRSDAEVIGNARQMNASLKLTLWLVAKFQIQNRNVIGHGESLQSPLRYERYASWRCRSHTDMARPAMRTYRGWLRDRSRAAGVPIGPGTGMGRHRLLIPEAASLDGAPGLGLGSRRRPCPRS